MPISPEKAKEQIYGKWTLWTQENPKEEYLGTDGLAFHAYLQPEWPALLSFPYNSDKWQAVHGWLLQRKPVCD